MRSFLKTRTFRSAKQSEWFMINKDNSAWCVYILECADGTYYTGMTNNLQRRLLEHNTSKKGAKYTRSRRPVHLMSYAIFNSRSEAAIVEAKIKKLKRDKKIDYLTNVKRNNDEH